MILVPTSLLALAVGLATACTTPGRESESFVDFFERAQADRSFRSARVANDFQALEELRWSDGSRREIRRIPCSYAEIERHGWVLLPSKERISASHSRYILPDRIDGDEVVVRLAPQDGGPDAEDRFELRDGRWMHVAMLVFTEVAPGQRAAPVPCDVRGP